MDVNNESQNNMTTESEDQAQANGAPAAETLEPQKLHDELKAQLKEQQNKYLYLYADFENYKKRAFKERSDFIKFGHESFARELLQVSDNLERALSHTANTDALVDGIKMVQKQLQETLAKFGVVPVQSVGAKFDPQLHEAVGQEKIDAQINDHEEGVIVREHQKGYTLHGRLLRPARVIVAVK